MNFTKTQRRAILFLVVIFSLVVGYHYVKQILYPVEPFDFSKFEEKFNARRDSIKMILEKDEVPQDSTNSNQPIPQKDSRSSNHIININTATKDALTKLPKVGPVIAERIIDYRNQNGRFISKEDIQKVKGIGEKTYEKLKDLITVN